MGPFLHENKFSQQMSISFKFRQLVSDDCEDFGPVVGRNILFILPRGNTGIVYYRMRWTSVHCVNSVRGSSKVIRRQGPFIHILLLIIILTSRIKTDKLPGISYERWKVEMISKRKEKWESLV